ncbi:MAG: hypothetical protein EBS24_08295, partial [Chitinophagia bacterium]|nr:hypothetical protein [Chitinophagia bacterium]
SAFSSNCETLDSLAHNDVATELKSDGRNVSPATAPVAWSTATGDVADIDATPANAEAKVDLRTLFVVPALVIFMIVKIGFQPCFENALNVRYYTVY